MALGELTGSDSGISGNAASRLISAVATSASGAVAAALELWSNFSSA